MTVSTWVGTPNVYFGIGLVAIILSALLLMSGMKNYFTFQKILFIIAISSAIVTVALLATTSHQTFMARFNAVSKPYSNLNDTYDSIIQTATSNGYTPSAPFSLLESIQFFVWPWLALGYCMTSASYAGEIKNVKKSQILGMMGAVVVTGVLYFLLVFLGGTVFGYDFLGASSYIMFNGQSFPLPVAPWYSFFTALLTDNPFLSIFILVGWFSWFLMLTVTIFLFASRTAFAWAIDGMIPNAFAYVNEKFRTPFNAIIVSGVGGALFLAGIAFTTWLGILSGALAISFVWLCASIAAIIFPFHRKEFYARSGINYEIAKIPVISIVGSVNAVWNIVAIWIMVTDARAGANSPISLSFVGGLLLVGVVLFYAMRAYRKRQGVDTSLTFKAIPVE